jgi:hypothetical protein
MLSLDYSTPAENIAASIIFYPIQSVAIDLTLTRHYYGQSLSHETNYLALAYLLRPVGAFFPFHILALNDYRIEN